MYRDVLGHAWLDGPGGLFLRGRPLPRFVEALCGSIFEGSKLNCIDPGLESSFFVDGSGYNTSRGSGTNNVNIITSLQ